MPAPTAHRPGLARTVRSALRAATPDLLFHVARFVRVNGYVPNLIAPVAFNEKVLCKMLFDRDPRLPLVSDKLAVRTFIARICGEACLPELLAVWERPEDIACDPAWGPFVVKSNHGSAQFHLVPDPARLDLAALRQEAGAWLSDRYGEVQKEWCYKAIEPRVFAEGWIGAPDRALTDFKLFCFGGTPRFMKIIRSMTSVPESAYCDFAYRRIELHDAQKRLDLETLEKPPNLGEMIEMAAALSRDFEFIRVDMFNIDGRIVVGELTNYPLAAAVKLSPRGGDLYLGSFWDRSGMTYLPLAKLRRRRPGTAVRGAATA